MRNMAGDRFEVHSAGTKPVGVNPNAVQALAELGIDISGHRSKSVDEFSGQSFEYIITVCDNARESCPVFPGGGVRLHHAFEDPATFPPEQQPEAFARVRDEIRDWLLVFISQ